MSTAAALHGSCPAHSSRPSVIAWRGDDQTDAPAAAGPFSLPLIGDLPWIFKYGLHEYGLMCHRKYGKIFKVRQRVGRGRMRGTLGEQAPSTQAACR